jgi:secondary thiamine-phosphate synthase enzyme
MREVLELATRKKQELVDITGQVQAVVDKSAVRNGVVHIYAQGATAAIMIQENWDESVQEDVIDLLSRIIPHGGWRHDAQDGNGDAHLKAGIVGPSETVPVIECRLGLSRWQNIFFCEFDGPRSRRSVVVTVVDR